MKKNRLQTNLRRLLPFFIVRLREFKSKDGPNLKTVDDPLAQKLVLCLEMVLQGAHCLSETVLFEINNEVFFAEETPTPLTAAIVMSQF